MCCRGLIRFPIKETLPGPEMVPHGIGAPQEMPTKSKVPKQIEVADQTM